MGFEDRDYMRSEHSGDGASIMPEHPACRWIIISTVVMFLIQVFFTRPLTREEILERVELVAESQQVAPEDVDPGFVVGPGITSVAQDWFQLDSEKVKQGQVWRLVTSVFLHDRFSVWHILVNMAFLYFFGRAMESRYGTREFLTFYFCSAVFASLLFFLLQLYTGERIPAIGASGAVLAVVCLYTMHHPYDTVYLMFFLPMQMRFLLILYAVFDLHPVLMQLSGVEMNTGTAHSAHLGGLLFGFVYWKFQFRLAPIFVPIFSFFGSKRTKTVHKPLRPTRRIQKGNTAPSRSAAVSASLEKSVDEILRKISEQGEDSLTESERETLTKASEQYRRRNNH